MSAEVRETPINWQHWPCGPECGHAQPMANTYGEWHWCAHPQVGGRVVRDGKDCIYYQAASTLPTATAPSLRQG